MKKGTTLPDEKMKARYRKVRVSGKQMSLHRAIMQEFLGRELLPSEVVHHINGNKLDNRLENLTIMSVSEHSSFENKGKVSKSLIGNQRRKGIPHSDETKSRISLSVKRARKERFWSTKP